MTRICDGRVVIVTGGGRGIGRSHALAFAREGAKVVVNDLGTDRRGSHSSENPAADVVEEIRAAGGIALASNDDVADWDGADRLIRTALNGFGALDVLVNNAGILRDRMIVNMSIDEWDSIIRVHLRGTFAPTRIASSYWRGRAKAGLTNDARVINTTSASGIYSNAGQANYGAAKAGIAAFTLIAAKELNRYGVTVNAIAPGALTRMTENTRIDDQAHALAEGEFDPTEPDNISPLVVWLASTQSSFITGRVFNVRGGYVSVAEGWHAGPGVDKGARWDPAELGSVIPDLVARAVPSADLDGRIAKSEPRSASHRAPMPTADSA